MFCDLFIVNSVDNSSTNWQKGSKTKTKGGKGKKKEEEEEEEEAGEWMNEISFVGRFFPLGATTTTDSVFLAHTLDNNNNNNVVVDGVAHCLSGAVGTDERSFSTLTSGNTTAFAGDSFLDRCSREESLLFSTEAYRLSATHQRLLDEDDGEEEVEEDDDDEVEDAGRGRDETMDYALSGEEEVWWRKNSLVWSSGRKICKTFTLPSTIVSSVFCDLFVLTETSGDSRSVCSEHQKATKEKKERHLCALYSDGLYLYSIEHGTTQSVVLPCKMSSIWPSPFGLLLERSSMTSFSPSVATPASSSSLSSITPPLFSLHHPLEEIKPIFSHRRATNGGDGKDIKEAQEEEEEQLIEDGLSVLYSDENIRLIALYDNRNCATIVSRVKWFQDRSRISSNSDRMVLPDGILPELTLNHIFHTAGDDGSNNNVKSLSWGEERAARTFVTYGCHDSNDPVFAFIISSSHSIRAISFSRRSTNVCNKQDTISHLSHPPSVIS